MQPTEELTQPVETGLAEAFAVTLQGPSQEAPQERPQPKQEVNAPAAAASVETIAPVPSPVLPPSVAEITKTADPQAPINIVMPSPPPTSEAARKNKELYDQLMARRNTPPAVRPLEPPIPRITEQTKREMAEGARVSAHHAAQQAATIHLRKPNAKDLQASGNTVPVFRPEAHVPGPTTDWPVPPNEVTAKTDIQRGVRVG